MSNRLESWGLGAALRAREQALLLRQRRVLQGAQGPHIRMDGRDCLAFCSNDYLGLAAHPEVVSALRTAAADAGVGSGASALICGRHALHAELEEALADFMQRPACLLFSTGYMANLGVATALLGRDDAVFSDALNHASLIDAARLCGAAKHRYGHGDVRELQHLLSTNVTARRRVIMTDGLFSMDGDCAPLGDLARLADQHGAALWVDDAHGIGVLGDTGCGTLEHLGLAPSRVDVLVGTLGKAFGAAGAFVCGEADLVETLVQHARNYIYTTAPPPPLAAACLAGLRISRQESWRREHLLTLVRRFRAGAAGLGIPLAPDESPIQPLVLGSTGDALRVADYLLEHGILALAMRPPTVPEGTSRLRITLSAAHTEADVDRLLEVLAVALDAASPVIARAS